MYLVILYCFYVQPVGLIKSQKVIFFLDGKHSSGNSDTLRDSDRPVSRVRFLQRFRIPHMDRRLDTIDYRRKNWAHQS